MIASLHKLAILIFLLHQLAVWVFNRLVAHVCDLLRQRIVDGQDDDAVDFDDPAPVLVDQGGLGILGAFFVQSVQVRDDEG